MNDSKDFTKDVIDLWDRSYTAAEIAHKLAKKYSIDMNRLGRGFINFKARVGMCILRHRRRIQKIWSILNQSTQLNQK